MPKIHLSRSVRIQAPIEEVYDAVSDFNHWKYWSPWLIQEPDAQVTVAEDAKYYEWEGKMVGSGNMNITAEQVNQSVDYDLTFLKPWKSKAKVRFELASEGEGTKTTWFMDSSLPFFMFWMKKMMTTFIGMDYDRGLALLKDYVEDGEVHSKLERKGYSNYPGCAYIGIQTTCKMQEVGPKMQEDLGKLGDFLDDKQEIVAGPPFSIYHKWDVGRDQIRYTSGVPVKSVPGNLPAGLIVGEVPQTRIYTVAHIGPYHHLGNAWTTLYTMQRNKLFRLNKKADPFEVYLDDPHEVPANELRTEIHFPVK